MAGNLIGSFGTSWKTVGYLAAIGAALVAAGLVWGQFFPINKKLWTSSFVFLTVGIDCIILAGLIYITDFLQKRKWGYFFEVFGKNPLFIYLLSEVGVILLWFFGVGDEYQPLFNWIFENIFSPAGMYFGSFLFAISFMLLCWLVGYWMDKKKIYVRV
jgi:predicted acyltransferase